jgi:hypothetical protein
LFFERSLCAIAANLEGLVAVSRFVLPGNGKDWVKRMRKQNNVVKQQNQLIDPTCSFDPNFAQKAGTI